MIKFIKWAFTIIIISSLFFCFVIIPLKKSYEKKKSPQQTVEFVEAINGSAVKLSVNYSRPYKKGREIFGGLVPFGEVWRTGANENTVFTTNKDLVIGGHMLPAGNYSLWTIPEKDTWTIIWSRKQYFWGKNAISKKASRQTADDDALQIQVPVEKQSPSLEQFTISFEKDDKVSNLVLAWDTTKITVPFGL